MKLLISSLIGFVLSLSVVSVSATPLIEGRVRLGSGEPVEAAQVRIFDMTALQRGAIAHVTTDATGYFALPLAALGGAGLPQAWTLGQNYPNPFNPATIIPYQVPTASWVRLDVFNVLGQRIATLVDKEHSAGVHTAVWDATDAAGRPVGAGVYFYRLHSAGQPTLTRRMVLIDGQAGQATARVAPPSASPTAPASEGVYGLSVTGAGLVTYVDASFGVRVGMASVEVVVDAVAERPRGKALTGGVLGDVNGDGLVSLDDVLLVMTYVFHGSVELPPAGNLSLGDVNGDGQVALDDALLLVVYVANPADGSLPSGLGEAVSGSGGASFTGVIRRLTNHEAYDGSPAWSPDGKHIAFTSYRDDNAEIYVMEADGSNPRRLTNHEANDFSPVWSPAGQHIAFESERDGNRDIYVMGSDGSNFRRLTNHEANDFSPVWSPAGQHIAFDSKRDDNWDIYVMGSDGSNLRRLTNNRGWDWDPVWSPAGQHIAFESNRIGNRDIYVMGSDGSNLRRLTNDPAPDWSPVWSPAGQHIAFESERDGNRDIYVMGSDGSNFRRLTNDPADDEDPVWSPAGQHIAFESERDDNRDIYVMGSDGSNLRRLTNDPADDEDPVWSPAGQHIAFESNRDGNWEIYVMELRPESDAGDIPAGAISLAMGESLGGDLSVGDIDYFRVTVRSPGRLVAWTTGSTDTYGVLEDSSGSVLNEDNNSGEGRNFFVSAVVEPGTYYIGMRGHDSNTGTYTLTVQMDEDYTPAAAIPLAVGEFLGGDLSVGDIDYFRVTVNSPGRLVARTTGSTDTYGVLEDSSGSVLNEDNNSGEGRNFFVSAVVEPGTYYIRVRGAYTDETGAYTLRVGMDEDYTPAGAVRWLGLSGESDLSVEDIDYSRVTVRSPGRLVAYTTGSTDTYGVLEDSSGSVLNEDNNSGEGRNFFVSAVVEPGTYYIRVSGATTYETGAYTLEVGMDEDYIPAGAVRWLGLSEESDLSVGDIDYFRVTVNSPGRLVAYTTGSTDTYGILEDSSGSVLNEDNNSDEGRNFFVSAVVEPGTYYIRVSGAYTDETGTYTLKTYMLRRLTNDPADDEDPVWSPDGQHIAFESDRDGNRGIYVMGSDGSNLRRLTNDPADDEDPVWSPDGQHIVFESERDGNRGIYVMGSDGSNLRRLTNNRGRDWDPVWSPAGQHIAFESDRDGNWDIYVMGSDGSNLRRLTNNRGRDLDPVWSPAGQHIAFESDRDGNWDIYVMGSDGSNLRRLTNNRGRDLDPVWSPAGQHIAFLSSAYRRDNEDIYVMGSDGSNLRHLTDGGYDDVDLAWSPDGQHIAFSAERRDNWDIYVMGSDGSNLRRLTNDRFAEDPVWSPDGQHIAFYRRGGSIYVIDLIILPSVVDLYDTLISSLTNVFFAVVVGATEVPGEGGGSVEIAGNEWKWQDYSPDGELIINGTLNVRVAETPIPLSGTIILSGSHDAELVLDMAISVAGTDLSATGTITIDGTEFDVAALSAAAEAAAAGE